MSNVNNPFLQENNLKYNVKPFDKIRTEHFMPAIESTMATAKENITVIKNNTATPDFENTILALETCSEDLDTIIGTYFNLYSAESDGQFKELAQRISPMMAEFSNNIILDEVLFEKVKSVYENIDSLNLNNEQIRLTEKKYLGFVRNGANLDEIKKIELRKLNQELSKLSPQFSKNVLDATNDFELHITNKVELSGLPESALSAAENSAKLKGKDSGWLFTLQMPSWLPIMKYADNRKIRKAISTALGTLSVGGKFDNSGILKQIAKLKHAKAQLLGFESHADYTLQERMAKKTDVVMAFLDEVKETAMPTAKKDVAEVSLLAKELDDIDDFSSWDFIYYSEKLKQKKFDYDEEELRPYFKIENVFDGIFTIANKLYGITFKQLTDIPVYHSDVLVYEVTNDNGDFVGLFYMDMFPRETKRNGAWMTTFREQGLYKGEIIRPHVSIVANLTPSTPDKPSLLDLSEVRTIFHEFGHALHGLLSDCSYQSLASPNVYWDFVELPSQIMENWLLEKEALDIFAKHYETGETIPQEQIEKIKSVQHFNAGYQSTRQVTLGLIDMAWHTQDTSFVESVEDFENSIIEELRLLPKVEGANTSCSFGHIFGGGYSAGYYSYKWAEVLDADAFELFKEKGIFNQEIAESFKNNILSRGNTAHPMDLYLKFRGQKPDPKALFRRDGFIK
ncbi:MAG: M3 family metallopeptidase [Candidatus Marinimicrobia bacterium]|nr:M3 family metallopeptidase [Candidatus Neomarinimicrobiota bacterium]MBL7022810.1 M3 family metallopeptidase [Candidatus Neomarinimicrobiota bacterium]MBL7109377.1 M3 family metallopeptidase [Candidatus Neomarinimicrobiota bacterium]